MGLGGYHGCRSNNTLKNVNMFFYFTWHKNREYIVYIFHFLFLKYSMNKREEKIDRERDGERERERNSI